MSAARFHVEQVVVGWLWVTGVSVVIAQIAKAMLKNRMAPLALEKTADIPSAPQSRVGYESGAETWSAGTTREAIRRHTASIRNTFVKCILTG
jgi:hypothetical protein